MGLTASLDMGSEKMVMALAVTDSNRNCRLTGIKIAASLGVQQGIITDKQKTKTCIQNLINELIKDKQIDVLNVALSGDAVCVQLREITLPLPRKIVEYSDLNRAEQECIRNIETKEGEIIDLIPESYIVDHHDSVSNPVGMRGKSMTVYYRVYMADMNYLSDLRKLFFSLGIENESINFFPLARVYAEAFDVENTDNDFAVVDLGAMSLKVLLFKNGMLSHEAVLPLGTKTIDYDIMTAFGIDAVKARKLKHENGQALRSACKNKKIVIPDTKLSVESRDLSTVVQCRMEELLEGVVYLLQSSDFDELENEIILTGGGSRLGDVETLLNRLSGHKVTRAKVKGIDTPKEEALRTPEYLIALGLLRCVHEEAETPKTGIIGRLKGLFG